MSSLFDDPVQILDDVVTDYFGDTVVYVPVIGNRVEITAILSSPSMREESAHDATIHDAFVRLSEFENLEPPRPGDAIEVGIIRYRIFDVRADHGRGYKLSLQKS